MRVACGVGEVRATAKAAAGLVQLELSETMNALRQLQPGGGTKGVRADVYSASGGDDLERLVPLARDEQRVGYGGSSFDDERGVEVGLGQRVLELADVRPPAQRQRTLPYSCANQQHGRLGPHLRVVPGSAIDG